VKRKRYLVNMSEETGENDPHDVIRWIKEEMDMGADGHIRFYDQGKVDKITNEINLKYELRGSNRVSIPAYACDFRVNGQYCYIYYWECQSGDRVKNNFEYVMEACKKLGDYAKLKAWGEFENRCDKEAILVEDQEVWT